MDRSCPVLVACALGVAGLMPPAAHAGTGGTQAPSRAVVEKLTCVARPTAPCASRTTLAAGSKARVDGRFLKGTAGVVFEGSRDKGDELAAAPRHVRSGHFELTVPVGARSGPVVLISDTGQRSRTAARARVAPPNRVALGDGAFMADGPEKPTYSFSAAAAGEVSVDVVNADDGTVVRTLRRTVAPGETSIAWNGMTTDGPAPTGRYAFRPVADGAIAASTGSAPFAFVDHIFPIRGKHDLGQSATNNFGGGRGHQGQDMFATCGTPLAAARGGRVRFAGWHAAAGNYVVITSPRTKLDYVYMHMRDAPLVATGDRVSTGQQLGVVGVTGRASGCQLHFELWSAPGWYTGGSPIDPLPRLRAWDRWS